MTERRRSQAGEMRKSAQSRRHWNSTFFGYMYIKSKIYKILNSNATVISSLDKNFKNFNGHDEDGGRVERSGLH